MKKNIKDYWNKFYNKKIIFKESSFARFVFKKFPSTKKKKLVDVGCGNGRDSFYFNKKGYDVTGLDLSNSAIQNNSLFKNNYLNFNRFDIEKNSTSKKFDIIYSRFFIHALSEKGEKKFIKFINKTKKNNTFVCLEFR